MSFANIFKGGDIMIGKEHSIMIIDIGDVAGEIWDLLKDKGELSLSGVASDTHRPKTLVNMSLGWLAREDKITVLKTRKGIRVALK